VSFHSYRDGRARGSRASAEEAADGVSPRLSVSLPGALLAQLADEAERRRVPVSQVVRECCHARFPAPSESPEGGEA
jgi:hypothetical protein